MEDYNLNSSIKNI